MIILFLAIFATATLAAFGVGLAVRDLRASRLQQLRQRTDGSLEGSPLDEPIALERRELPGTLDESLLNLLTRAGNVIEPPAALTIVAAFGLVGCAFPLLAFESLIGGVIGLLIGITIPLLWWAIQGSRRLKAMNKDLPETFDALADALRGGRSLQQAAQMVAEDTTGPLSKEFDYCASQLRLGHSPVAVLERMVKRIPLAEFKMFAIAVTMHQQTGGNLSRLVSRLSSAVRDRQEFRGHLAATTAGSRLSAIGLIVASVLGVAILSLIDPEYVQRLVSYRHGPMLIVIACILQVSGIFWLWKIMRIKY